MELILLEKILNLGDLGEKVTVKSGYGRNYLLPQGKAVPATKEAMAEFEARRAELEKSADERLAAAQARQEALQDVVVEITSLVSPEGKLYGSIGAKELSDKLTEMGHAVEKLEVDMGEGPIREPGEYNIGLQLHADVECSVKVVVTADE